MRNQILLATTLFCLAAGSVFGACTNTSPYVCTSSGGLSIGATNQNGNLASNQQSVSGVPGTISTVAVTLDSWTDSNGDTDREFMLVFQPTGCSTTSCEQTFQFAGGVGADNSISGVTVTFEDSATNHAPGPYDGEPANNATYKPTVNNVETTCSGDGNGAAFGGGAPFSSAPCATYNTSDPNDGPSDGTATFASQFSGSPNGSWTLYVWTNSEAEDNSANIASWKLTFTTQANAANTSTTLTSNATNNETTEGTSVTLTATVSSTSTVSEGTVDFTDNGATISNCGSVAVSNGTAICNTSFSTEGYHPLEASYSGDSNFGSSHGTLNFFVDHATSNPSPGVYCNTGTITINTNTQPGTTPYPQHITIPSTGASISDVSLTLSNITTDSDGAISDYNFLLVDPNGHKFVPLANAGGQVAASGVTLTLSDYGSGPVPNSTTNAAASGTYLPTDDNSGLTFASSPYGPPSGPYQLPQNQGGATFDTTFGGANPSGLWSLYVYDTSGQQTGTIGGYCLNITTSNAAATTTTVTSNPNGEATTGQQVTFTATVKSGSTPVTSGTVTFKENGTVLSGPTTVNGSGQMTFQTSSLSEGIHTITANYSGVTGTYNVSSGQVTIEIDTATTNPASGVYCNPGGITISASNSSSNIPATPYPSRVDVTNLAGTVNTVSVSLNNFSDGEPSGTVMLLEGPTAPNIVFWNGVGGDNGFSSLNLKIADSAGSGNPIPAPPSNNSTYYPTSDQDGLPNPSFPSPAPSSLSYAPPMGSQTFTTAFGNTNPIGFWSLYIYDRFGDEGVSINNWCLNVTNNPPVVTLAKVHNGTFTQGDTGDTYTITVANPSGPGPTAGTMTLTDTLPTGITATAMSQTGGGTGSDWTCTVGTTSCTRTTAMAPGESDTITLTVNVSYNTSTTTNAVVNNVSLTGGGISGGTVTASDTQTVQPGPGYALNLSVNPSGAGTVTANPTNSAGLTAGHYVPGATVTLTATPTQTSTTGYAFSSWSGSADLQSTSANPTTITMNSATESVTANFQIAYQQTSGVTVAQNGGWTNNRITKQSYVYVTVTNTTSQAISGPIQVVASGMPAGVTGATNTGTFNGNPYWTATGGSLGAGQSVQIQLYFHNPNLVNIGTLSFTAYSGNL